MHTKLYIITFILLYLSGSISAEVEPVHDAPVIPRDSVTDSLYQSFTSKLDSAQSHFQKGEYQQAVRLYAVSFDELNQFSELRRENDGKYLAAYYETEEKEQRITFLNQTLPLKRKQNHLLILLSIFSVATLILLFTFQKYRLRIIRQRADRRENETRLMELEKEQHLLETRLQNMEMEKYQKELLAESLLVNHKNKVIDDLRLFLVHNPKLNTYRTELEIIFNDKPTQPEATEFNTAVDDIHPVFYEKLQERAANRLTALDLEYCRMIYMKMTSKEMSEILQVDPNTIRMGKYRLKQKLGLSKEDDLNGFIEEMGAM